MQFRYTGIRNDLIKAAAAVTALMLLAVPAAAENAEESAAAVSSKSAVEAAESERASGKTNADISEAPGIDGLTCESVMPLDYATCFNVFYYNDGYKVIDVPQSAQYLLIPEGMDAPEGLSDRIVQIRQPLDSIYLAASSAMALFDALDAVDKISMSGTSEGTWEIDAPLEALESGDMVYGGKYSEPDYETMIALDCDLAIESTMILHSPEVQEMIEDLDIPVFIDRSAYETGPLGRTEWVKLYGALMGKDEEAGAFFDEQERMLDELEDFPNTGKTIAYFSVNTDGSIVVRTDNDYIPSMLELAGGQYLFRGLDTKGSTASTMGISMEQFYSTAMDADYLIYNATIEAPLSGIADLTVKDELFADFRAVQDGNVWQVDKKAYQSTDKLANLILDFHHMLTDDSGYDFMFLTKLE